MPGICSRNIWRRRGSTGECSAGSRACQLARFRRWDVRASARVDRFVAISEYIAERIRNCYRRDADVIYPPVDVPAIQLDGPPRESFYLTVSRLVPYKRVDLLVQAFRAMPDRQLVVAGDGPEMKKLARLATSNVRLLGAVDDAHRDRLLRTAKAFIFAADEDFGIAPLEAQALGTPVIAFGRGGSAETIRGLDAAAPTGVLFAEQSVASIGAAVAQFEASAHRITAAACRANAERFSRQTFNRRFSAYVTDALAQHRSRRTPDARDVRSAQSPQEQRHDVRSAAAPRRPAGYRHRRLGRSPDLPRQRRAAAQLLGRVARCRAAQHRRVSRDRTVSAEARREPRR